MLKTFKRTRYNKIFIILSVSLKFLCAVYTLSDITISAQKTNKPTTLEASCFSNPSNILEKGKKKKHNHLNAEDYTTALVVWTYPQARPGWLALLGGTK